MVCTCVACETIALNQGAMQISGGYIQAENRAVLSWNSLGTLKSSPAVAVA